MTAPDPFVPPDVDLRNYSWMPLHGDTLLDSDTWLECEAEEKVAALTLWWKAWHQLPAGSLPNNDKLLSAFAGYGVAVKQWISVKPNAMRNWVLCSDGRYYHRFLAKRVAESWLQKLSGLWLKECERLRKENKKRAANQETPLPIPAKPSMETIGFPPESLPSSAGKQRGVGRKDGGNDPPLAGARVLPDRTGQDSISPTDKSFGERGAGAVAPGSLPQQVFKVTDELLAEAAAERERAGLPKTNLYAERKKYELVGPKTKSRETWLKWAIDAHAMGHDEPVAEEVAAGHSAPPPKPIDPKKLGHSPPCACSNCERWTALKINEAAE